tara:strand:+ start:142 stop:540 length:399 start_codon:yes stop_codon:yes gene_type:complete
MMRFLALLISFILIFPITAVFADSQTNELSECIVITHCVLDTWEVSDVNKAFKKAAKLIGETPRTKIIENTNSYLHAEATTRWMHYVDDLELKAIPSKSSIQVRSESRVGIGDNGVNKRRVDDLAYRMTTNK